MDAEKYVAALNADEIKHPLLASLRVRVKKPEKTDNSDINTLVVEATPVYWDADAEIPNDSVNALHGLLATGGPPSSERLVAARLEEIAHSPFYNMTVAGEPAEKGPRSAPLHTEVHRRPKCWRIPRRLQQRDRWQRLGEVQRLCRAAQSRNRGTLYRGAVPRLHSIESKLRSRSRLQSHSSCQAAACP